MFKRRTPSYTLAAQTPLDQAGYGFATNTAVRYELEYVIMDAKEVVERSKALQKATAAGEPPAHIVKILNELKTGVKPTEDLLRSTKIGVVVNRSKQHPDRGVATLASEIVKKWRDEVQRHKGGTPTPNGSQGVNGKKMNTPPTTSTASPAPTTAPTPAKPTIPPDQRDYKKDGVSISRTNQATRDNCIGLLYNGLAHTSTVPSSTIITIATSVEEAAFRKFGPETQEPYKAKVRSLFQNLKNKSNPTLRVRVLSGEIVPDRFVVMTHEDLKSAEQKKQDVEYQKENLKNAEVAKPERSISTSFECGKCKQKKVAYNQAQTRSADEPMTTFCECQNCGNRWKADDLLVFLGGHGLFWVDAK
ncbi:MAG: hypothetical protein L6R41_000511 [Letrouitia leprolyta]|nr:MAG: hypothetical protein L6R41_000511 [Letrouitia leprolyta]